MNSDNMGKCEKELVRLDDDFERLCEQEDICTDSEDRKNESEIFEEISGGDNDAMNEGGGG
jgi:hypothetical protein